MKIKITAVICFSFLFSGSLKSKAQQVSDFISWYKSEQLEKIIAEAAALDIEKTDPEICMVVGRAFTDSEKFKDAIGWLEKGLASPIPSSVAWSHAYLGLAYFALNEREKSKKSLLKCIEMNATANSSEFASKRLHLLGLANSFNNWYVQETEHLLLHFEDTSKIGDVKKYAEEREQAFQNINNFFNSSLPKKIDVFVWNSKEKARLILQANIGFSKPEYCIVHKLYTQTPGHEITHNITHYIFADQRKSGMVNEGVAVYFDQSGNDRIKMVKSWLKRNDKSTIDCKDVWLNWKSYSDEVSYPLAGEIIGRLINNFGKEKFLLLLKDQSYANAEKVYGNDLKKTIESVRNDITH